jgi:prolipoprotein diacylglyceryltransferase
MFTPKFMIFLLLGTLAMLIPICIQAKWYGVKWWKTIVIALLLTVSGTLGTYLWFFVENGRFGGRSFYGAVFIVPVLFILVSWVFRIPYGKLMDLCAPAECIMLVLMKALCVLEGCCKGRILFENVRFPSQIAELVNALILLVILMYLSHKKENRGKIYPMYLLIYGASRFVLNFFRDVWAETWMPMGTLWSILAMVIGGGILVYLKKKNEKAKDRI